MAQEANIRSLLPEEDREGASIKADVITRNLVYSADTPVSDRLIVQVGFNRKTGMLNLVRANGDTVSIHGFLTDAQMGEGPRGDRGPRGRKGKNGRLGRPGKKGKTGCEGPQGTMGLKGETGLEGPDGPRGNIGLFGCPGIPGPRGDQGPPGPPGDQGPRGASGPDCIVGPKGDQGYKPKESVYYGTKAPGKEYYLWAKPVSGTIADKEQEPDPMTGTVKDVSVTMSRSVDDAFVGNISLYLSGFSGGKGPFSYKWSDQNDSFDHQGLTVESKTNTSTLKLKNFRVIDPQDSYSYSGKVQLVITDKGTDKKLTIKDIKFSFKGTNDRQPVQEEEDNSGGPVIIGGGGCVHQDTPILMWDGTKKKAKYLQVGETVQGFNCDTMIDESEPGWEKWKSTDLKNAEIKPTVIRVSYKASYKKYWTINKDLVVTDQHPLLVKKDTQWGWYDADQIEQGDVLKGVTGTIKVESISMTEDNIDVVIIDAEPYDNYFAGNTPVLMHNALSEGRYWRKH